MKTRSLRREWYIGSVENKTKDGATKACKRRGGGNQWPSQTCSKNLSFTYVNRIIAAVLNIPGMALLIHLNSSQHCNKQHFQPSLLYCLIIWVDLDYHGYRSRTVYICLQLCATIWSTLIFVNYDQYLKFKRVFWFSSSNTRI